MVIERYGYRSIGGQTVEGSLNQEVYEKIAGVYGQILKAPEHKEYAEAQQKMAGLRNTDTEAYYKLRTKRSLCPNAFPKLYANGSWSLYGKTARWSRPF